MLEPQLNQHPIHLGDNLVFGKKYTFNVPLKNVSDKVINVNKVYVGCTACTTASVKEKTVKPNESVDLEINFTPGSTGVQNKQVSVVYSTEDFKTFPDLQIKFKGVVNG